MKNHGTCICGHSQFFDHLDGGYCRVRFHQKRYGTDPGDDLVSCGCENFEEAKERERV